MVCKVKLKEALDLGLNVYECMEVFNCSRNTVTNYVKKYFGDTPERFYSHRDKKIGRPKGIPMSESQKKYLSKKFSGKGNPFYGRKHSKPTKKLMSDNHADFSGDKNPFRKSLATPGKREAHRQRARDRWSSYTEQQLEEIKTTFSKAQVKNFKNHKPSLHKNHNSGHYFSEKFGEVFFFRSDWELQILEFFSTCDLVVDLATEELCIPYMNSENRLRYTKPDLEVTLQNSQEIVIEVKPSSLLTYKENPYKLKALREYCQDNNLKFLLINTEFFKRNNNRLILNSEKLYEELKRSF